MDNQAVQRIKPLYRGISLVAIVILLVTSAVVALPQAIVSAQETIVMDENKLGQVAAGQQASYFFAAQAGQEVKIEVLGIGQGFAPQFTITDQNGALVQAIGNPSFQSSVTGVATFPAAGNYVIQVAAASGQGQFLITLTSAVPAIPPTPLVEGQPSTGQLAGNESITYSFPANPANNLTISLGGSNGTQSVSAELKDASGQTIAVFGSQLISGTVTLPPGQGSYTLKLSNSFPQSPPLTYQLSLTSSPVGQAAQPQTTEAAPEGVELPMLPTTGACVLATLNNTAVNVRSGPSTDYEPPVATISQFSIYSVVGRNNDGSWYQIDYGGGIAWVAASVTRRGGNCTAVPVVAAPPPPSSGQQPQATEQATQEATQGATQEATQEVTPPATEEPTPEATQEQQAQIAGDNEVVGAEVNIKNDTKTYSGHISYPNGDTADTVSYRVVGFDSVTTSGNVNITVTCTGPGAENARVSFSGQPGGTGGSPCNTTSTQFHTTDSDQGRVNVWLPSGNNAYVTWTVILSANN